MTFKKDIFCCCWIIAVTQRLHLSRNLTLHLINNMTQTWHLFVLNNIFVYTHCLILSLPRQINNKKMTVQQVQKHSFTHQSESEWEQPKSWHVCRHVLQQFPSVNMSKVITLMCVVRINVYSGEKEKNPCRHQKSKWTCVHQRQKKRRNWKAKTTKRKKYARVLKSRSQERKKI